MIRVGQVLKIPAAKPETTKPATDPVTAAAKHAFLATKSDLPKPPITAAAKPETPKPASAATPPPKSAVQSSAPNNQEVPPAATDGNTYTVAKGDNPYSIAKKLHVSYNELIAINDIKDPTRVQIGQKLKIPPQKK
jgi:LysM repeat protein